MKKVLYIIICILSLSVIFSVGASSRSTSLPKPRETIYINDFAGVVDKETEDAISDLSAAIDSKSKAQIAVVTVDTTQDQPIEDYSLRLLRKWGIGDKTLNTGVVILIAVNDKQARIEVGYGLEDVLNDAKCGRILDDMLPYFREGDYSNGILSGYNSVASIVSAKYDLDFETPNISHKSRTYSEDEWLRWYMQQSPTVKTLIGVVIFILLCLIFGTRTGRNLLIFMIRSSRSGPGGRSGGSGGFGRGRGGSGGGGGASRRW